jgi:hypothetical protein
MPTEETPFKRRTKMPGEIKKVRWVLIRVPDGKTPRGGTYYRFFLKDGNKVYRVLRKPPLPAIDGEEPEEVEQGAIADYDPRENKWVLFPAP